MFEFKSIGELERDGAITAIQDGNHGAQHPTAEEYVAEGIPFVMASDIRDGRILFNTCKRLPRDRTDRLRIGFAKSGDVLLTHKGTVGEVAIVPPISWDYVMLTPQVTYYRVNHSKLDRRFLLAAFRAPGFQAQLSSQSAQSTRPYIGITAQRNLRIPVFPLPIQRRIASILSAYDDLIENNTRRIAVLEEMARRIYEEWFVRFRFPGHEQVKMVESELGLIPEGWTIQGVYDLADVTYGFPFKAKEFRSDGVGRGVIRIRDIRDNDPCASTAEEADPKYLVSRGDILIGMDGQFHMGKWAGPQSWLNQRVLRLKPKADISRNFLFLAVREPIQVLEKTIVGTTVAHLSAGDMKSMRLIVPSPQLMEMAGKALDPLLELELNLHYKNANLRATRDLLLPKLISGELDVSNLPEPEEAIAA